MFLLFTSQTTGGLYFWSAKLAGPKYGPFASWITGWFNLLGQVAVTAGKALPTIILRFALEGVQLKAH